MTCPGIQRRPTAHHQPSFCPHRERRTTAQLVEDPQQQLGDPSTFWITKKAGLSSLSVLYSPLYSFIKLQQPIDSPPSLPAKVSMKENCSIPKVRLGPALRHILIILMLFISGNIHPNPGRAIVNPAVPNLSFNDFCEHTAINFRSLLPKLDLLKSWAHTVTPDVLAISGSWLERSIANPDISIPGYNIFHQDRVTKGGGVALYVKDHLRCTTSPSKSVPKLLEPLVLRSNCLIIFLFLWLSATDHPLPHSVNFWPHTSPPRSCVAHVTPHSIHKL